MLWPALRLFRSHIFSTQIFFYLTENPQSSHQKDLSRLIQMSCWKTNPSQAVYPDFISSLNTFISVLMWMLHCVWFLLLRRHFPHTSPELNAGLVFLLWFTHPSQLGSYNVWKWSSWHLLIPSATSLRVNHIWNNSVSVSVLSLVLAECGTSIDSGEKGFNVKEKLKWIVNKKKSWKKKERKENREIKRTPDYDNVIKFLKVSDNLRHFMTWQVKFRL